MNKKELQAMAQAAAKNIKTEDDLNDFRQMLTKITVEAALNAELTITSAMINTSSQMKVTAAMAFQPRSSRPKMASLT